MIALGVCLISYALRGVHFSPLARLVSFEDQLYDIVFNPKAIFQENAAPIVFVDIDDDAIGFWRSQNAGAVSEADSAVYNNTPRALIARLTHEMRAAGAAVIYLDFDFRSHLRDRDDEETLHAELARPDTGSAVVLAPVFFARRESEPTAEGAKRQAPELIELPTILDGDAKQGRVTLVHPLFEQGPFGIVDGAPHSIQARFDGQTVSRVSAMRAAVVIVRKRAGSPPGEEAEDASPVDRIYRWDISAATPKLTSDDHLRYLRIPAGWLLGPSGGQTTSGEDRSKLKGVIVVISATTLWSSDTHDTPVGERHGALLHLNLAYDLQLQPMAEPAFWVELVMDVIVLAIGAATTTLGFYVFFRRLKPGPRLTFAQHLGRLSLEIVIAFVLGVAVFFLAPYAVSALGRSLGRPLQMLDGWRFGVLTYLICAFIVLAIEAITTIADAVSGYAQDRIDRLSRHKQQGGAST
jgi:hypothetical protein